MMKDEKLKRQSSQQFCGNLDESVQVVKTKDSQTIKLPTRFNFLVTIITNNNYFKIQ